MIYIPEGMTDDQHDYFMIGFTEMAMNTCFENIGINESEYFNESDEENKTIDNNKKKSILENIIKFFDGILDKIKKAIAKVITWIQDSINEFSKKINSKIIDSISKLIKNNELAEKYDDIKIETKYLNTENIKYTVQDYMDKCLGKNFLNLSTKHFILSDDDQYSSSDGIFNSSIDKLHSDIADMVNYSGDLKSPGEFREYIIKTCAKNEFIRLKDFRINYSNFINYLKSNNGIYELKKSWNKIKENQQKLYKEIKNNLSSSGTISRKSINETVKYYKEFILFEDAYIRARMTLMQYKYTDSFKVFLKAVSIYKSDNNDENK